MKTFKTKDLSFLLAVAPLMGAHASDTSEEDTARAFGLSLLEYRQQVSQYTGMASAHESTIAEREEDELVRAMASSMADLSVSDACQPLAHSVSSPILSVDASQQALQVVAALAGQVSEQERLLNEIYMNDVQASLSNPGALLLQAHALQIYGTVYHPTLEEIGMTFQERLRAAQINAEIQAELEDQGQNEGASGNPDGGNTGL
jgi:hypothetical protein